MQVHINMKVVYREIISELVYLTLLVCWILNHNGKKKVKFFFPVFASFYYTYITVDMTKQTHFRFVYLFCPS